MQRLQLQRAQIEVNKSFIIKDKSSDGSTVVIDRFQQEIGQLKAKLAATEQALEAERSARESFESDLKKWTSGQCSAASDRAGHQD